MTIRTFAVGLQGWQPFLIEVETDATNGLPGLQIIGLAAQALTEAKERLISALRNSQVRLYSKRTVINLAPADIRKTSSSFDLAMAVGLMTVNQDLPNLETTLPSRAWIGELSLDGSVKPVKELLPAVVGAARLGLKEVVVPAEQYSLAHQVPDINVLPVRHLSELLPNPFKWMPANYPAIVLPSPPQQCRNWQQVLSWRPAAARAALVALAGGHHLLFIGPPGVGKTKIVQAMPELLPDLKINQQLTLTSLHSLRSVQTTLLSRPPVISPHHTTSATALLGGGPQLLPGAISLAHTGVLILDELSEFNRQALESLRQPLSDCYVTIDRAGGHVTFPSDFQLLATTNPCPCGHAASSTKKCHCSPQVKQQYQRKLIGPFADRIEMTVFLDRVEESAQNVEDNAYQNWPTKIKKVREVSKLRLGNHRQLDRPCNHHFTESELSQYALLSQTAAQLLQKIIKHHQLSARAIIQLHSIALTISDLEKEELSLISTIENHHLTEALQYRYRLLPSPN